MVEQELLTPTEGARLCRVKVTTFREWLVEGKLPSIRLTRKSIRVRRSDLDRFLNASVAGGAST